MVVKEYIIKIHNVQETEPTGGILEDLSWGVSQAEDAINDQLPEGWYCKIVDSGSQGQ